MLLLEVQSVLLEAQGLDNVSTTEAQSCQPVGQPIVPGLFNRQA